MEKNEIIKLSEKYKEIHPLMIKRTIENIKSTEELVYTLENLPSYPVTWNKIQKKWINKNAPTN